MPNTADAHFVYRVMKAASLMVLIVAGATVMFAQAPSPPPGVPMRPSFEVVSIKRSDPGASGNSFGLEPGGHWRMVNRSIGTMIRTAYPAQTPELVGAPAWVTTEAYDITARAEGNPDIAAVRLMMQSLLADRFKLEAHYETQERPVFSLVVARSDGRLGPGLVPSTIDCAAVREARNAGRPIGVPPLTNGAPVCGWRGDGDSIRFGGLPLARLPESLGPQDGRVLIDKTGLTGGYEFTLRFNGRPDLPSDMPLLFTALEEQLGLKLIPDREPLRLLVIDRIERPSED